MDKPVVLCEYSSRSTPNKKYHIIKAKDNSIYCDCWQWKKTKTCAHLDHYKGLVLPAIREAHRKALHDEDGELLIAIDKAVTELG